MSDHKKYHAGCAALRLPVGDGIHPEALYALLAARGYSWDGEQWLNHTPRPAPKAAMGSVAIRAGLHEAETLAAALYGVMEMFGAVPHRMTGPKFLQDAGNVEYRIDFTIPYE